VSRQDATFGPNIGDDNCQLVFTSGDDNRQVTVTNFGTINVNVYTGPRPAAQPVIKAIEPAAPESTEAERIIKPESTEAERIIKPESTEAERIIKPETTEPARIVLAPTGDRVEPVAVAAISELLYRSEENRRSRHQRTIVALLVVIVALLATLIGVVCWNQHESQKSADKTAKSITRIEENTHGIPENSQEIAGTLKAIQDDKPVVLDWAPLYGAYDKGYEDGYVSLVQTSKKRAATGLDGAYGVTIGTDSYKVVVTGPHTAAGVIYAYVQDKNGHIQVINLTADELNPNGGERSFSIPLVSGVKLIKVTVKHLNNGLIVLQP